MNEKKNFFCPKNLLVALSGGLIIMFFVPFFGINMYDKVGGLIDAFAGFNTEGLFDMAGTNMSASLFDLAKGYQPQIMHGMTKEQPPGVDPMWGLWFVLAISIALFVLFIILGNRTKKPVSIATTVLSALLASAMVGGRVILGKVGGAALVLDYKITYYVYTVFVIIIFILSLMIMINKLNVYSFSVVMALVAPYDTTGNKPYTDYNQNMPQGTNPYVRNVSQGPTPNVGSVPQAPIPNVGSVPQGPVPNVGSVPQGSTANSGSTYQDDMPNDLDKTQVINTNDTQPNAVDEAQQQSQVEETIPNFCPLCGRKLGAGEFFCGNCGHKII